MCFKDVKRITITAERHNHNVIDRNLSISVFVYVSASSHLECKQPLRRRQRHFMLHPNTFIITNCLFVGHPHQHIVSVHNAQWTNVVPVHVVLKTQTFCHAVRVWGKAGKYVVENSITYWGFSDVKIQVMTWNNCAKHSICRYKMLGLIKADRNMKFNTNYYSFLVILKKCD